MNVVSYAQQVVLPTLVVENEQVGTVCEVEHEQGDERLEEKNPQHGSYRASERDSQTYARGCVD